MNEERLAELIEAYLDGALTAGEAQELRQLVDAEPVARERFLAEARWSLELGARLQPRAVPLAQRVGAQVRIERERALEEPERLAAGHPATLVDRDLYAVGPWGHSDVKRVRRLRDHSALAGTFHPHGRTALNSSGLIVVGAIGTVGYCHRIFVALSHFFFSPQLDHAKEVQIHYVSSTI